MFEFWKWIHNCSGQLIVTECFADDDRQGHNLGRNIRQRMPSILNEHCMLGRELIFQIGERNEKPFTGVLWSIISKICRRDAHELNTAVWIHRWKRDIMEERQLSYFKINLLRMHKLLNNNRKRQSFYVWRIRCSVLRQLSAARNVFLRAKIAMLRDAFGQWMFFTYSTRRLLCRWMCVLFSVVTRALHSQRNSDCCVRSETTSRIAPLDVQNAQWMERTGLPKVRGDSSHATHSLARSKIDWSVPMPTPLHLTDGSSVADVMPSAVS